MSPRLAPNGLVVAFIAPGGQDGRPPQIQAIGTEGNSLPIPLTDSPYDKRELAWSPNGEWLAYTEDVTGCGVLMLMDYQKRRSIPLTTPEDGCVEHFDWAHQQNALLFDTIPPGQNVFSSTIKRATIDAETQEVGLSTWISDNAFAHPVWAPDDSAFAALSPGDGLYKVDMNSGVEWQLVASTTVLSPTWPAGPTAQQYILYLSEGDVWRVPADGGGNVEQISPEGCQCVAYALSEDNTWLAYLKQEQEGDTSFSVGAVNIGSGAQAKIGDVETAIPTILWHTIDNPADE
jgi:Tol biopolymer transport system component